MKKYKDEYLRPYREKNVHRVSKYFTISVTMYNV